MNNEIKLLLKDIQKQIIASRELSIQHRNATTSTLLGQIKGIKEWEKNHELQDSDRFGKIDDFINKMTPFMKVLENNKIGEIYVDTKRKTVVMYAKDISIIGGALIVLWTFIKFIFSIK